MKRIAEIFLKSDGTVSMTTVDGVPPKDLAVMLLDLAQTVVRAIPTTPPPQHSALVGLGGEPLVLVKPLDQPLAAG